MKNLLKSNIIHYVNQCLAIGTNVSTIRKDLQDTEHHKNNFNDQDKKEMDLFLNQILEIASKGAIK
tara:strand:- start:208 stop:405 length:198 start_codon:yes stop_codon:yes gene_type:complete